MSKRLSIPENPVSDLDHCYRTWSQNLEKTGKDSIVWVKLWNLRETKEMQCEYNIRIPEERMNRANKQ